MHSITTIAKTLKRRGIINRTINILENDLCDFHRGVFSTSSNGNIFCVPGLYVENPPVTGGSPWQRPVTRIFDVSFDKSLNIWLIQQSRCRRLETPWRSLWHHCNVAFQYAVVSISFCQIYTALMVVPFFMVHCDVSSHFSKQLAI